MYGLRTRLRSPEQLPLHRYDLYDIAYLAGGHVRAADTVAVALAEGGRIRVLPEGRLAVVALRRRHPVEAAALDIISGRGWRDIDSLRWRFETDPRLTAIAERLRQDGLIRDRSLPLPRRRRLILRRTRAGRRLLHQLRLQPPADALASGTNAMAVALHGTTGMPDRQLREDIFGPFCPARSRTKGSQPRLDGTPQAPYGRGSMYGYNANFDIWHGQR
jgi:hypothetical protein